MWTPLVGGALARTGSMNYDHPDGGGSLHSHSHSPERLPVDAKGALLVNNGGKQPKQQQRATKTPSLMSLFSPDAAAVDDGMCELDRMTGGLESCLSDAAEVVEALEAGGPSIHTQHVFAAQL